MSKDGHKTLRGHVAALFALFLNVFSPRHGMSFMNCKIWWLPTIKMFYAIASNSL